MKDHLFDQPEPSRTETPLNRRHFIKRAGIAALGLAWALPGQPRPAIAKAPAPGTPPTALLDGSPYVYISPLRSDGKESSCHAELWYAWLDESVIVTVARDRWKARALAQGLTDARIWVGDHGRWNGLFGRHNEAFREAPNFMAQVEKVEDPKMIDRLLAAYEKKYPHEIASWRDKMRSGNADGSRIMLRYKAK